MKNSNKICEMERLNMERVEVIMRKKDAVKIIEVLKEYYPDCTCSLDFGTPFQLLVAVMLSAQCTDERVNKVTPGLFKKYGTPEAVCKMDIKELEKIIHSCGFYKNKAKNIKETARIIVEKYDGVVQVVWMNL